MNKSALTHNPVHHQRSKHIDINYHWLLDNIADGTIAMAHVSTTDQRADILNKVVDSSSVFHRHVTSLMCDVP
jgi:predicted site-specific integrase-resolvase